MKLFIAGSNGMVGSAVMRAATKAGEFEVITKHRSELDLLDQTAVEAFMASVAPDLVVIAAARVGGIHANNNFPAEFIYENLMIQTNIINAAFRNDVSRLIFLGSSCIYPKYADQPITEESLLTDLLEPTNEPYGIAKIAGIKMCESYNRQYGCDFRSLMPTNLYGFGDNFHELNSHVIPALFQKFHLAKAANDDEVIVWGTGQAKREFLFVDDLADAVLHMLRIDQQTYQEIADERISHINIGTGIETSIAELSKIISSTVGYGGKISHDRTRPDGAPRKCLDVSKARLLGWSHKIDLVEGLSMTYEWFKAAQASLRAS